MPRSQLLGVASCLLLVSASANGVRAGGDAAVAEPSHRRLTVPDGVEITDLGCFRDSRGDRVLDQGLMGQSDLTPEACASYCFNLGSSKYYGLQWGQECWCGSAGTNVDRLGALSMDECSFPCTGDSASLCGGYDSFQAFEFGALDQPAGYLGCYADSRGGRVFSTPQTRSADNTAETCKAACSGGEYAFYGLQWGSECFCGRADEDYTLYGASDACGYRCTGDALSTCGGFDAIEVFALDETTTPPPAVVTPAPTLAPADRKSVV